MKVWERWASFTCLYLIDHPRSLTLLCFCPHSASWLRLVQTQSACLNCAGTTTGSRQLPSFTVSWSSRSSKPSRSPRRSPTATSSPPLDQDSTLFRHWKNRQTLAYRHTFLITQLFCLFILCFPVGPFFWGRGGSSGDGVGNFLKKDFTVLQVESCSIHLVQTEWGRMFNNYIYKATFFQSPICKLCLILFCKLHFHCLLIP